LDPPQQAGEVYPYTGKYQFVPMLKTTEWPLSKIYQLARLHVSIIEGLQPLFITNLQDVNNVIDVHGNSLMQGFYGMTVPSITQADDSVTPASPLIHSIHNTSKNTTKAILIQKNRVDAAVDKFANISNILKTNIHPAFHENVFIPGKLPTLTGRQADSIFS
jgi:hypothetical protein